MLIKTAGIVKKQLKEPYTLPNDGNQPKKSPAETMMDFKQRGQDIETASWLNENKGGKLAKKGNLAKWRASPPTSRESHLPCSITALFS